MHPAQPAYSLPRTRAQCDWASQEGGREFNPDTGAEDPNTGYPNECLNSAEFPCAESHTLIEYGYIGNAFLHGNNKDVGMLILDDPIVLDEYASVAAAGSVDGLPVGTEITYSGYGVSREKPAVVSVRERLMATGFIVNTHNTNTPPGSTSSCPLTRGKVAADPASVTPAARSSTTPPTSSWV